MSQNVQTNVRAARPVARTRHLGWVSRAVVSGFLGSISALLVLLAAYGFAAAVGTTDPRANIFSLWMYNLANNPVTRLVQTVHAVQALGLHLVAGIVWAIIYAAFVEQRLPGPGWRKGLMFAIVPLLFSELVFLPIAGVGVFGAAASAGPLAGLGAVLLHAVYGFVLGETYALADGEGLLGGPESPQAKAFTNVERDMAIGLVAGAVIGAVLGLLLMLFNLAPSGPNAALLMASGGAVEGAIAGIVVGLFVGFITS